MLFYRLKPQTHRPIRPDDSYLGTPVVVESVYCASRQKKQKTLCMRWSQFRDFTSKRKNLKNAPILLAIVKQYILV